MPAPAKNCLKKNASMKIPMRFYIRFRLQECWWFLIFTTNGGSLLRACAIAERKKAWFTLKIGSAY
jgi:hypothetical protein